MINKSKQKWYLWRKFFRVVDYVGIGALIIGLIIWDLIAPTKDSTTRKYGNAFFLLAVLVIVKYQGLRAYQYFHNTTNYMVIDLENEMIATRAADIKLNNIENIRIISWKTTGKWKNYKKRTLGLQFQTKDNKDEIALFYGPRIKPKKMKYWRNLAYSMQVILSSILDEEIEVKKSSTRTNKPSNVV